MAIDYKAENALHFPRGALSMPPGILDWQAALVLSSACSRKYALQIGYETGSVQFACL